MTESMFDNVEYIKRRRQASLAPVPTLRPPIPDPRTKFWYAAPAPMRVTAALLVLLLLPTLASAQSQQPTFRGGVELIEVDVTVLDGQGNPVPDLEAPEFMVTVDDEERRIVSVEFVAFEAPPEPSSTVEAPESKPYYSTNQGLAPGRLVILVVDENNIRFGEVRKLLPAAGRFLDQLGPADRVAFAALPATGALSVGFTTNHQLVREALARVVGSEQNLSPDRLLLGQGDTTRSGMSVAEALSLNQHKNPAGEPALLQRVCGALNNSRRHQECGRALVLEADFMTAQLLQPVQQSMGALRALLGGLQEIDGPKTLLLISEGLIADEQQLGLAAAAAARVTIHALLVDSAGYQGASTFGISPTPNRDRVVREQGLRLLSSQAGGGLFRIVGMSDAAFQRLGRELSGYYVLGVETDPRDQDGRPHQIRVEVRRSGTTVRARQQFQVSADRLLQQTRKSDAELLAQALRAPFPIADLPLRLATYAHHDAATSKVRVRLAAEIERADEGSSELGIGVTLINPEGRVAVDTIERSTLAPVGGETGRVLKYIRSFLVDPGTYTLRVAAIDGRGRLGSVEREVHAWEMSGEPLAVGDLIVDNAPGQPGEPIEPGVDVRLDTGRLAAYLELYAADPGSFQSTQVAIEVAEQESGPALTAIAATLREMTDSRHQAASAVLPVGHLPAGPYVARAIVLLSGAVVGKLVRPFHIPPDVAAVRAETEVAPPEARAATSPESARTRAASHLPAVLPSTSPFQLEDVLRSDLMTSVLDLLDAAARPEARSAIAQARSGRLEGAARQAFDAGDQFAASFLRGLEMLTQGRSEPAAIQFNAALRIAPAFGPALFYLGASHAAGGRDRAAVVTWRLAVAAETQPGLTYGLLGDALLRLGDAARALDPLREALSRWPDDDGIRRRLAIAHATVGQHDEALSTIEPYLPRHASDHEALLVAIQAIYEAHLAGHAVVGAEPDRERLRRYADAYAAANGPYQALVSSYLTRASTEFR